jgi:ABC-type glycerol-3-phosphate transport system permease component
MTRVIEGLFLVFMFLPQSASIIGTIYTINALGLTNNLMGIILSSLINLRIYFYLKDEFLNLSSEIFESLAIDGVGTFKLIRVIFGGIFREKVLFSFFLIFISNWNNFLVPINVISKELLFTLPVLIASLSDPLNYFIGETFLALLFQTIPLILLYIFLMRSIDSNYEL